MQPGLPELHHETVHQVDAMTRLDDMKVKVAENGPDSAARLVFQWVKTGKINVREFKELYPLIDQEVECDKCGGTRGGVPGNEQLCGLMWLCDTCAAEWLEKHTCQHTKARSKSDQS